MSQALRVKWYKVYLDQEGKETREPTTKPSTQRIEANQILEVINISRDGVLGAEAARRFDHQGWQMENLLQ